MSLAWPRLWLMHLTECGSEKSIANKIKKSLAIVRTAQSRCMKDPSCAG